MPKDKKENRKPGTDPRKLRDYGLGTSGITPTGPPRVGAALPGQTCPNCSADQIFIVSAPAEGALLRGGKGVMTWVGCPACPWASKAVTVSTGVAADIGTGTEDGTR